MSSSASVLHSSRREAAFVVVVWLLACAYTVGYCALFGYRSGAPPELIWGIPGWIVWGVLAPWFVVTAVTCWYAFYGIRDEDLGEDEGEDEGAPEPGDG